MVIMIACQETSLLISLSRSLLYCYSIDVLKRPTLLFKFGVSSSNDLWLSKRPKNYLTFELIYVNDLFIYAYTATNWRFKLWDVWIKNSLFKKLFMNLFFISLILLSQFYSLDFSSKLIWIYIGWSSISILTLCISFLKILFNNFCCTNEGGLIGPIVSENTILF